MRTFAVWLYDETLDKAYFHGWENAKSRAQLVHRYGGDGEPITRISPLHEAFWPDVGIVAVDWFGDMVGVGVEG